MLLVVSAVLVALIVLTALVVLVLVESVFAWSAVLVMSVISC